MTKSDFKRIMLRDSGCIQYKTNGEAYCTVCGSNVTDSEDHADSCKFYNAMHWIDCALPDNFTLEVENKKHLRALIDILQKIPVDFTIEVDKLTERLTSSSKRRRAAAAELAKLVPTLRASTLDAIIEKGLQTEKDRLYFRNYCLFERVVSSEMATLMRKLDEIHTIRDVTSQLFDTISPEDYME